MALIDRIAKIGQDMVPIPGTTAEIPKAKPFQEVGVSGLLRTKGVGYIYDEFLSALSVHRQKQIYREMRDNDAVIGAMFFALEMILRRAEWRVEPGRGKKADQYAQFIKECMEDMSHTWEDFIAECVSMFTFGFALFETVYKRRQGADGRKSSRYDDGLIGWRKMAPRAQESILYWIWDDEGGLQGAVQLAAPDYKTVAIPIEKLLLFRTTSLKNSPEGRSVLRNVFRSWFFKRRLEEVEGIGIERDLCGIPVLYSSAEALAAMGGEQAARALVTNIRVDDQAGVILPLAYDEKGNQLVKLELMRTAGAKQTDPNATIQRYNSDMLNTLLAGFIQLGQTPTGSFSLHMSASQIFALAISAFMDSVAAVINRIAIPRLMSLNRMDVSAAPRLMPGEIGSRDMEELANYVQKLSMAGITFFDTDTANYLRKVARLPEQPEGQENAPQQPAQQQPPGKQPPGKDQMQVPAKDAAVQNAQQTAQPKSNSPYAKSPVLRAASKPNGKPAPPTESGATDRLNEGRGSSTK